MDDIERANIETDLIIATIKKCYGWDFSSYKKASFKRRLKNIVEKNKLSYISDMIPCLIHDDAFFSHFVNEISVPVTEMFRDPLFFKTFRKEVIPILKTYPFIKIWHAGCADGKEVYSLAILLYEEGLYDRCKFIGTDINTISLAKARDGIYNTKEILDFCENYTKSGGRSLLKNYFHFTFENAVIHNYLKQNVHFQQHNLIDLESIGMVNIIFCQNVFIYFNKELQEKIIHFFQNSLYPSGFLCLGAKESIQFSAYSQEFEKLDDTVNIYRKLYQ